MNWSIVRTLAEKDLLVVRRSRALMVPLVAVPVLLLVLVPLGLSLGPIMAGAAVGAEVRSMIHALPEEWLARLGASGPEEQWLRLAQLQLLPGLFLLVPFVVANVIAADSFAGERERKTLEALLYTPATDAELLAGKLLAAWVPALAVAVVGFAVQTALLAGATAALFGRALLPQPSSLLLVGWLAPAFAALGLAGMVLVSLRVRGTQEAMQLGGLLVLPVVALMVSQATGALFLGPAALLLLGSVVWALAWLVLAVGRRRFRRTRLVTRL